MTEEIETENDKAENAKIDEWLQMATDNSTAEPSFMAGLTLTALTDQSELGYGLNMLIGTSCFLGQSMQQDDPDNYALMETLALQMVAETFEGLRAQQDMPRPS